MSKETTSFPITVLEELDFSEFSKEQLKEMRNETFHFFNNLLEKREIIKDSNVTGE